MLSDVDSSYEWFDQAQLQSVLNTPNEAQPSQTSGTGYFYDPAGPNTYVHVTGAHPRDDYYVVDTAGDVLKRREMAGGAQTVLEKTIVFGSHEIGQVGNDGLLPVEWTFQQALSDRGDAAQTAPWRYGLATPVADVDQNYDL